MLADGQFVTGEIEAKNRAGAIEKLAEEGRTLFELSQGEEAKGWFTVPKFPSRGVSATSIAFATRQLAETLDAGMPLVESILAIGKFTTDKKLNELMEALAQKLLTGQTLSQAVASFPKYFGATYVSLIKVGEHSGKLPEMMEKLADYLEKDLELRQKVKSALTYPTFVLCFCVILCYVLIAYLLPGFEPIWVQSGLDLSKYPITEFLLFISKHSRHFWDELILAAVLGAILFTTKRLLSTAEGARRFTRAAFKTPITGHFLSLAVTARVANSLATLVDSGVALNRALLLSAESSGLTLTREALEESAKKVERGKTLAQSVEEAELFPPLMVQMIASAKSRASCPACWAGWASTIKSNSTKVSTICLPSWSRW